MTTIYPVLYIIYVSIETIDPMAKTPNLTSKQAKFVASYQLTGNATESAINAGYPSKTAPQMGSKLVRNPKILNHLNTWRVKKGSQVSKEDFIDKAMNYCDQLDLVEPNKPRFMDIAGKALGYIGASDKQNSTVNNVQINIDARSMPTNDKWNMLRNVLEND